MIGIGDLMRINVLAVEVFPNDLHEPCFRRGNLLSTERRPVVPERRRREPLPRRIEAAGIFHCGRVIIGRTQLPGGKRRRAGRIQRIDGAVLFPAPVPEFPDRMRVIVEDMLLPVG